MGLGGGTGGEGLGFFRKAELLRVFEIKGFIREGYDMKARKLEVELLGDAAVLVPNGNDEDEALEHYARLVSSAPQGSVYYVRGEPRNIPGSSSWIEKVKYYGKKA
jgi:hypothetical protein